MKWTDALPSDVYVRLCDCKSKRSDVPVLVDALWEWYKASGKREEGLTKENALCSVLDLLDSNGIWVDPTRAEYDEWKKGE